VPLVTNHLVHLQTHTARSVRRLAKRLEPATIHELATVITADAFGRPPKAKTVPQGLVALRDLATDHKVELSAPRPILMGRHLLQAGLIPGKAFGAIIAAAYDAQLEGMFHDLPGALAWLDKQQSVSEH